ncbi:MAG: SpoIID/LytB domain-containing protein [Flavobacteriales bacterium]|nr:SpoIID/LytB domain-containing protein [Flavobacteriales bacterium]
MRFWFVLLVIMLSFKGLTQTFRISIFTENNIKSMTFQPGSGTYFLMNDTGFVRKLVPADVITVNLGISNKLDVKLNNSYLFSSMKVYLFHEKSENNIKLKPLSPALKERSYEGDFELVNKAGKIQVINLIDIDQYLEGVVESESGSGQNLEYYKAQTVISRTYALKYKNKHAADGFNLCDRVHCQAYLHRRLNAAVIDSAVRQTKNLVMLDEKDNLYATYFHANCGGQTCQPDYVWNETLPGFDSFKDTFCIRTKQANWEKKIPVNEWKAFMVNKYDFPIWDSLSNYQLYNFQQFERHAFFIHPFYGIPLRDLREAFQLKSTFFSCSQEGEFVVLKGRGFGHGVGLCQEGAMNMSKKGFDFQQILLFYYPKMRLSVQSDRLNRKM